MAGSRSLFALVVLAAVPLAHAQERDVSEPIRVSSETLAGLLISRPDPIYPPEAIGMHVSGAVVMRVIIGTTGRVEYLVPVSGPEMLLEPYAEAIRRWVYRPYLVDGVPRRVDTTITLILDFGGGSGEQKSPPDPSVVVRVSSGTMAGQLLSRPDPVVAPIPVRYASGSITVKVRISKEGRIVRVAPLWGNEILAGYVMDHISRWRYRPYVLESVPLAVDTTITVHDFAGGGGPFFCSEDYRYVDRQTMMAHVVTRVEPAFPNPKADNIRMPVVVLACVGEGWACRED